MNAIAQGALFAWPLAIVLIFLIFPPRRAAVASMIAGWLFLPNAAIEISGFPEYSKVSSTSIGVFLAVALTDSRRLLTVRWRAWDLPMLVWCLAPFASSMANGLGAWDGFSGVTRHILQWAIPYVIGRAYFRNARELRDLAMGIFIGGLIYAPLCLWEIRMSPNLHYRLYGFRSSPFLHHIRFGGYRPSVFLHSGLAVGMWLSAATICGIALSMSRVERMFMGMQSWVWAAGLLLVAVLSKAMGALALLFGCIGVIIGCRVMRVKFLLYLLVLSPLAYVALRVPGIWDGEPITSLAAMIDENRAASFEFRLENENLLADKALQQPVFGWGGWGRSRVYNDMGQDITVTDGFWIIAFGQHGFVGLLASMGFQIIPAMLAVWRMPSNRVGVGKYWPAIGLTCVLFMYAADNLLNAMPNPVFTMAAGALVSWSLLEGRKRVGGTARRARVFRTARQDPVNT